MGSSVQASRGPKGPASTTGSPLLYCQRSIQGIWKWGKVEYMDIFFPGRLKWPACPSQLPQGRHLRQDRRGYFLLAREHATNAGHVVLDGGAVRQDRKSTRLNSSHH